jgi:hypothetical protein
MKLPRSLRAESEGVPGTPRRPRWSKVHEAVRPGKALDPIRVRRGGVFRVLKDPPNLVGDPGAWAFPGAEHLLAHGSPCIDAGDPSSQPDPDGSPADIGAIPFDPQFDPIPAVFCTAKTSSLGCVPQIGFHGHATFNGSAPFTHPPAHGPKKEDRGPFELRSSLGRGSGGRIRTCDLRVMSPTSCQTAPPRGVRAL